MSGKIALVTGSNKGIGYAIVRELCKMGVGVVYLASRDARRGKEAVSKLQQEGLSPKFIQLDVTHIKGVQSAADELKSKHGGLDILINNAGILTKDTYRTTYEDAKNVIEVNYRSILIIQEYLYPILKENARVVNISSDCGHISNLRNKKWIERLTSQNCKVGDVNEFVRWFLDSVKTGTLKEADFTEMPILAYRISKVALTALTKVQQRTIDRNISINALHPGFVQTDMTNKAGMLTPEESAKAPVYLVLDAPQTLKGAYIWFDKSEKDWNNPALELYCHYGNVEEYIAKAGGQK